MCAIFFFLSFDPLCRAERSRHHMPTLGLGSVRALPLQLVFDLCLSPPFLSKCMDLHGDYAEDWTEAWFTLVFRSYAKLYYDN